MFIIIPLLLLWVCQSLACMEIGTLGVFIQTSEKKIKFKFLTVIKKIRKMSKSFFSKQEAVNVMFIFYDKRVLNMDLLQLFKCLRLIAPDVLDLFGYEVAHKFSIQLKRPLNSKVSTTDSQCTDTYKCTIMHDNYYKILA